MRVDPQRIRAARLSAGLTQDGLAHRARTSTRNIARWEGGQNAPRSDAVAAIAEATGHDVAYFFSNGDESEADEEEAALDAALLIALKKWRMGSTQHAHGVEA